MKRQQIAVFGFMLMTGCSSNTQIMIPSSTLPALKESEVSAMGGKKKPIAPPSTPAAPANDKNSK